MIGQAKSCGRKPYGISLGVALILLGTSVAIAQLPTATILGVVQDTTGAVVPGATLTARNVDTGQSRTTVSAGNGSYRFSALPVGSYEVRVEHPGFRSEVRSGLTLTVAQEAVVNFTLEVGAIEQTVAVTAEAPLVNTTSGSLGGLVDEQRVSDLPLNGRNYVDLALLQTGVVQHVNISRTIGVSNMVLFSSNGAPVRSNNYLLDGAYVGRSTDDSAASVTGSTLGVEGIREFRVITNSFSAEYGMRMGSQMVIVSKGGTNNFHGSAFEFLRNSTLDARNFFDRKTPITPRRLPNFVKNQFGGSFGGPIRKDQTFFHAVYEGLRQRLGRTIISDTISAAARVDGGLVPKINPVIKPILALYPEPNLPNNQFTFPFSQPTREDYGQIRVDHTFSSNDAFFIRYTIDDADQITPLLFPQFPKSGQTRGQFATFSENHIFSPTLLNTFRFSLSRTVTLSATPSGISGPQVSFVPGQEIGGIFIGGVSDFGTDFVPFGRTVQSIFTLSDDLFYTRGRHSLKFGTLINHYQFYQLSSTFVQGFAVFPNVATFLEGRPVVYSGITPGSITDRTYTYNTLGFYAQDDIRASSNFTLNLGLRYEFITEPVEQRGRRAALRDIRNDTETTLGSSPFDNPSLKSFSPRFGFAWDVQGDGRTAVRGGFALLYDHATFNSLLTQGNVATPPFATRSTVGGPAAAALFSIPFFFPVVGRSVRGLDFNLEQPHMLQYNLTLERQLPWDMAVTLAYSGSRGINIFNTVEGNPRVPQIRDGRKFFAGNEPRVNPSWDTIDLKTTAASSFYNSFQFGFMKRLSHGLQFQSSYTFSRFIDEGQGNFLSETALTDSWQGPDPSDLRGSNRALGNWDSPHNWRFNAIYRLPGITSAGALAKILNGWGISSIVSVNSGFPFTPNLASNRSRSGVNGGGGGFDRPDRVSGRSNDVIVLGGPVRYFDPSAFTLPPAGFLGNSGRNILRSPGFATLDFSVVKDTALGFLGESGKLEFRAEFFNILNRANFGAPNRTVFAGSRDGEAPLPTVGRINDTNSTSRQIQLALKLLF